MFFMYVDESGDVGMGKGSSNFFILSGLVIHEAYWYATLDMMASLRQALFEKYGFDKGREIHAEKLLGRSTDGRCGLGRTSAVLMLRDVLKFEAGFQFARVINVVVDKRHKGFGYDVFSVAWETLINRFENTMAAGNFPSPWGRLEPMERGFIIVDQTDENKLRELVRRMRWHNEVPSVIDAGTTYLSNLRFVVEDPMHKKSDLSLPIQLCDVNGYFLKQSIEPNSTIVKHKAKNWFYILDPVLLKCASRKDPHGIVWR